MCVCGVGADCGGNLVDWSILSSMLVWLGTYEGLRVRLMSLITSFEAYRKQAVSFQTNVTHTASIQAELRAAASDLSGELVAFHAVSDALMCVARMPLAVPPFVLCFARGGVRLDGGRRASCVSSRARSHGLFFSARPFGVRVRGSGTSRSLATSPCSRGSSSCSDSSIGRRS